MVCMCSYGRSHRRCLLQRFNSIYFKACGLAAKGHDTTHLYGITMSHSWVYNLIDKISDDARKRLLNDVRSYPFYASQDNLNLAFKVYEQRTNNQSRFDSGTAATVYVIKDPTVVWPERDAYHRHRAENCHKTLTGPEILKMDAAAAPRLRQQAIYRVIKFLIDTPAFDFANYKFKDDAIFSQPPPINQLPTGREHAVCQYILDTAHIESASQEGTKKCLDEWMKQLKLDGSPSTTRDHPTLKNLLVWIGDQLTTIRIRSVKKDRNEDFNFLERFDNIFEIFGWFHAQLAFETSLHREYYSTMEPFGLQHAFQILQRKGLHSATVKGNSIVH
jgi:hypothetical protein